MSSDKRQKILVVEDDDDQAGFTQIALQVAGYAVRRAVNGSRALAHAFFAQPALILVDVTLPDEMDGFEVLKRLKADETTSDIPVLMVSGYADSQTRERALAAGAAMFLIKPYGMAELTSCVQQILAPGASPTAI